MIVQLSSQRPSLAADLPGQCSKKAHSSRHAGSMVQNIEDVLQGKDDPPKSVLQPRTLHVNVQRPSQRPSLAADLRQKPQQQPQLEHHSSPFTPKQGTHPHDIEQASFGFTACRSCEHSPSLQL